MSRLRQIAAFDALDRPLPSDWLRACAQSAQANRMIELDRERRDAISRNDRRTADALASSLHNAREAHRQSQDTIKPGWLRVADERRAARMAARDKSMGEEA